MYSSRIGDVPFTAVGAEAAFFDPRYVLKTGDTMTGALSAPSYQIGGVTALITQTANGNTFVGLTGVTSLTSTNNTYVGDTVGAAGATGGSNTFIGAATGNALTSGIENVFVGLNAGIQNTTGSYNTFIGTAAGFSNITGTNNTYIGRAAGINDNGSFNTFLGQGSGGTSLTEGTSVAIGYQSKVTASNQLVIGSNDSNGSITTAYFGQGVTKVSPAGISLNPTGGSGLNNAGAALTIAGGKSTGNVAGGSIIFQTAPAGASSSTLNALVTAMTITSAGIVGIGVTPTAVLHLKAGTATVNTAPLKFNSGTLLTTAEAGAVEFLTDSYYATITTGAARRTFAFLESAQTWTALQSFGTNLGGTLQTAAQPNITSVGTLTGGATGAGFTVALTTSTITGTLPAAQMPALTGDITTIAGAVATTLATVATAGTTGSSTAIPVITINAKGLTTTITTAAVVAPAGTLTGTILNSTVVTSSLTSIGTLGTTGLVINNPAATFAYTIASAAIVAARTLTLPLVAGNDTFAVLGFAQTWTALQSFGTNLGGTLQTAAQTNITSVGTLTGLTVSGTLSHTNASPFSMTNSQVVTVALTAQTTGATTLTIPDFASVVDEFVFKTKSVTMSNKTFVAPALGAATATSINGLIITTTAGTLTVANSASASLITSGNFGLTLTATATTNATFPAGTKTLLATDGAGTSLTGIPYTLTGTANQVILSAGTGNITFTLPQSIATSSAVSFASVATSAASPLLLTNGQLVTIALTSQTVGGTTLTIPNFANVSDTFAFITLAQTLSNKTLASPTITTSATVPLLIGGTGTTSTLTLRSTSGVGAAGADLIFQTGNNGATEAMRILNSGNVGIGTASPNAPFHVSGTSAIFGVGEAGTPTATTIRGAAGTGSNIVGADLTFDASNGTGSGGSGNLIFRTAPTITPVITIGNTSSRSGGTGTGTYTYATQSIGSGANRILVLAIGIRTTPGGTVTSVTWTAPAQAAQNLTYTNLRKVVGGAANSSVEFWYLVAPTTGTNGTISVVTTNTTNNSITIQAAEFTNVDQTTPLENGGTAIGNSGNSAAVSLTGITTIVGDMTVDAAQAVLGSNGLTVGGSQVQFGQSTNSPVNTGGSYLTNASSTSWTISSSVGWAAIAISLRKANATTVNTLAEIARITPAGAHGIGVTSPTAILHLKAGTATANTAPLKFNSGTLLTTAEAGGVEFLTDAYYGTITTGAARKTFAFLESPAFTGTVTIPTLTLSAKIGTYNNIATAGWGVPAIYGSTSQRTESASDANVLTLTPPATAGSYRLRFMMDCSASTAGTVGWTATWKDSNGTAQAPTNLALNTTGVAAPALTFILVAGNTYDGSADIQIDNSATAIVIKLILVSGTFTSKVSATIEQLQ